MPRVWLSIGSNIDRERCIRGAIRALRARFGDLVLSRVYETPAEGFDGEPFYNLVAGLETDLPPEQLHPLLREIEDVHGRERSGPKFSARTLDIDLLTWGDEVTKRGGKVLPRDEILKYAFVLGPLAEVAPDARHPETGQRYADLWEAFPAASRAALHAVPFDWDQQD
jgi:2-amino-4-hydroxy-6-hydroxymethyldihydropteridine diphosphokinase